jgi:prepilin-type processing-associated H-X9-DG protein
VFLFADGNSLAGSTGLAVNDAYMQDDTLAWTWHGYGNGQYDYSRHRGKMNVVFVDGHAETVTMPNPKGVPGAGDRRDLDRVGLTKGIFD